MAKSLYLPVLSDWFPFSDMLLDNYMRVGGYAGVITKNWGWDYRGWVLFYNSYETFTQCARAYGYQDRPDCHGVIVGIGKLVEVREITIRERFIMAGKYNNWSPRLIKKLIVLEANHVRPFDIGFFFQNLRRFKEAVPFKRPPKSERSGSIFPKVKINSKIRRQIEGCL